ncbi:hypothetical protein ACFBZI_12030 [Moraxella sp. ZJ142]|uniref:hypothetical protein n=1 Tax=Moraxella marmotae TaxID=3344520 RepID=UPI0035D50C71
MKTTRYSADFKDFLVWFCLISFTVLFIGGMAFDVYATEKSFEPLPIGVAQEKTTAFYQNKKHARFLNAQILQAANQGDFSVEVQQEPYSSWCTTQGGLAKQVQPLLAGFEKAGYQVACVVDGEQKVTLKISWN